ncbi:peroxisomal membrane protein PMP34 isoform X4 [Stegostoma tigrinum]|uniref:peroxisomal membrane protein PMP34 isoform X4 n=1 Tax=Stegostoma tigrinum TaxID=3053191 RepID=UPI00202B17F7|nr:peroxisomal membrane protein PMP34 isoform X4 [Stegostoma tigrinum]
MKGSASSSLASYETLVHAVAGMVGSVTATTTFFPLDTVRIRLQVDEKRKSSSTPVILAEIVKEEGLSALYRGWFPVISSVCCSNFVYFYTFNSLKSMLVKGNARATPGKDLLMGCIADAFQQIITNEGVGTLWNGILPSLILVCNPGIQFMFYEGLKRKAGKAGRQIPSWEIFMIGAIAKAIATTVTYPLQIVQAILRFEPKKRKSQSTFQESARVVFALISERLKKGGFSGLYKGLEAKLLQTVFTAALMFLVYERIAGITFKIMGLSKTAKH